MGLSDETIETKARILNIMLKNNVTLDDPEQVKLKNMLNDLAIEQLSGS